MNRMLVTGLSLGSMLVLQAGRPALGQGAGGGPAGPAGQGNPAAPKPPEFPPADKVLEGLEKVVSTADGAAPLYELYRDPKSARMLAVLPREFEKQLLMIACTVTGGDPQAGVMGPTHYVRWQRFDKQLALYAPDFSVRAGKDDKEANDSIEQLYTGSIMLATPIVAMAAGDRPVIDLTGILTRDAGKFFGESEFGGFGPNLYGVNPGLTKLTKAKAFPSNIVVEYQAPRGDGVLVRFAYSIGELTGTAGYVPRPANSKVGFFYSWHQDLSKTAQQQVTERYINRWCVEKADAKLKLSPPKKPIVWYIEHTTPVRFRKHVRDGILLWNEAFREVGIDGALEVYQQDAASGAHMEKDPEDARYNFFRWNASDQGYAIGPSRANPMTGEILDADVVWHQGLTRAVRRMMDDFSLSLSEHAFGPETLAWLDEHPTWDPRVRLASPEQRASLEAQRAAGKAALAARPAGEPSSTVAGGRRGVVPMGLGNGADCRIGSMLALDFALADAAFAADLAKPESADLLDDLPEEFVGQMIRYISAHEVGHCLGLQHNMIASSIRSLKDINTPGFSGATIGSVMDYAAANINHKLGEVQGPYATPCVGPYDKWAIAYGYGPAEKLPDLLKRAGEPDLVYQSQAAISFGGDPRNNTWELGSDNLAFAESRLSLIQEIRGRLLDKVVKAGETWAMARRRYNALLGSQAQMLSVASRWVGGSFFNNDAKGDPGDRAPVLDVPAETQRRALKLIIDSAFEDKAYGLTPELVRHFGAEQNYDPEAVSELVQDPSYTLHDRIGGVQAAALTMVLNPTTLRRLYDNEFRASGENPITLAEVMKTVTDASWRECAAPGGGPFTPTRPMASSLRRNLQREHLERLVTLALLRDSGAASQRTVTALATSELKRVGGLIDQALKAGPDAYTKAHLEDAKARITRTLEAAYTVSR